LRCSARRLRFFPQLSVQNGSTTTQVPFVAVGALAEVSDRWIATPARFGTGSYVLDTSAPLVGSQNQQVTFATGTGAIGIFNQGLSRWGLNFAKNKP